MPDLTASTGYNGEPMKPAYTPDNTRSSVLVVSALAIVVVLIAVLVGVSDKPPVDAILISANDTGAVGVAPATNQGSDAATDDTAGEVSDTEEGNDASAGPETQPGQAQSDQEQAEQAPADQDAPQDQDAAEPTREVIPVPTSEPTPTPEIAAAVEPAAEQEPAGTDSAGEVQPAPSLPTTSGSVQGSFFTKSDENEGAVVSQNLIQVSFSEDGSGAFQGVLDITYADGTHILLNMSGPLVWLPTNPQVDATLEGAFTLDALIDTDDVMTDDAELSISSLSAGSGSLCTTRCFGFTFPPQ